MRFALHEVAEALGAPPLAEESAPVVGYSIDSRTLRAGELFFALAGEGRDGHEFVGPALASGAAAAVVAADRAGQYPAGVRDRLLAVSDPLAALQQLARLARRRWGALGGGRRLVAITGSAGKTTTKEMIAAALASRLRVLKSEGNFNNHLGLPLTLLRLTPEHEVAVVEMGMNHAGEITRLAEIAAPDVGVFTNVGEAHRGNFASLDALAEAKRELARALPPEGAMILNADDARVARFGDDFAGRRRFYGMAAAPGGLRVEDAVMLGADGSRFTAVHGGERVAVEVRFPGRGHMANAAAALATGLEFDLGLGTAALQLRALQPGPGRGRSLHVGGMRLIDDCYNANPAAMEQMLQALTETPAQRRIAVLGEMLELGVSARSLHRRLGRSLAALAAGGGVDALFAVQGEARAIADAARAAGFAGAVVCCADAAEAGRALRDFLRPGDAVLFKASRGVGLEAALAAAAQGTH